MQRYAISCEPLKNLGWSPQKDFDKKLLELVQHYKRNSDGKSSYNWSFRASR